MHAQVGVEEQIEPQLRQLLARGIKGSGKHHHLLAAGLQLGGHAIPDGGGQVDQHHLEAVAIQVKDQAIEGPGVAVVVEKTREETDPGPGNRGIAGHGHRPWQAGALLRQQAASQGPGDQAAMALQELAIVAVVIDEVVGMAIHRNIPVETQQRLLLLQSLEALLAALPALRDLMIRFRHQRQHKEVIEVQQQRIGLHGQGLSMPVDGIAHIANVAEQVAQFRAAGGIGRFEFGLPDQTRNRIAVAAHRLQQPGELAPELPIPGSELQTFLEAEDGGLEILFGGQPFRQGHPANAISGPPGQPVHQAIPHRRRLPLRLQLGHGSPHLAGRRPLQPHHGQPIRQKQPALSGAVATAAPHQIPQALIRLPHGLLCPGGKVGGVRLGGQAEEWDKALQRALDQHKHYRPLGCRQAAFPPCWTSACSAMTRS